MSAIDVIEGGARWACDEGDNLDWLRSLPDGCCSLTIFSPPYEAARTYSIDYSLRGQEWVDWLALRVVEMCRVTSGLVVMNAAGQVRDHSYSPVVEWLVADLTRRHGVVCGPAPYVYFRFGIPGSGGKRYHRRDWEPCYAFCRPDVLPLEWSDNTAEGHPPRWAPGGEMSNRQSNGNRRNEWGMQGGSGMRRAGGARRQHEHKPPEQADATPGLFGPVEEAPVNPWTDGVRKAGGSGAGRKRNGSPQSFTSKAILEGVPTGTKVLANPGNVVRERYDAEEVRQLLGEYAGREIDYGDVIRCLVGGGAMGSALAHENEAPFPERLAEFFVRSYAAPGSVVCDPFSGSGTTLAVAVRHGRRAVGCDVRASQVELVRRRVRGETPPLFPDAPEAPHAP